MDVSLRIAWRYLFSKKKRNAINIVSAVSAGGVCVVTAAMIIVFSVMNGFSDLVGKMFSNFDPDLKISASYGKTFSLNEPFIKELQQLEQVEAFSPSVEETALIECGIRQIAATLKGVGNNFTELTNIDSIIVDGRFGVSEQLVYPDGTMGRNFERCVLGVGLADALGVNAQNMNGLLFYAPKKREKVNLLRPDRSLNQAGAFVGGIFCVKQDKYDTQYALVSLQLAQQLFDFREDEVSCVEIKLKSTSNIKSIKKRLQKMSNGEFVIKDRYEQQSDFYKVVEIEKLLTALLLTFILLVAAFNIIGSLSMLMIDKREDMQILHNLGASTTQIKRIFLFEGWLISLLGAAIGIVIGIAVCLLQEHFGLLKLGDGTDYIISAYPVVLHLTDVILTNIIVITLGFFAAWIPTRQIGKPQ